MSKVRDKEEAETRSDSSINEQDTGSSENELVFKPARKKRRKTGYVDFAAVARIFPDVTTKVACQLSEMAVIRPSHVLELVPEATTAQIAEFLKIAETVYNNPEIVIPEKETTPKLEEGTSQLKWLKKMAAGEIKKAKELCSPTEEKSEFMKELEKIIPPKDGGNGSPSVNFSEKFQETILDLLGSTNPAKDFTSEHFEKIYEKLVGDPLARSRIENLHAARAHKYGHAHFGPKIWYKESLNLAKKFKSQTDRRKFRIGLKGLMDFLNQLNIKDLEKLLHDGDSAGFNLLKMPMPMSPEAMCSYLKAAPPIKIIECMNKKKAADILELVGKISSLAHFSQSMAEYFARDDALEPALAVVCEVLRTSQDVGAVLQKNSTSFLSLAQPFDKHRSGEDRDAVKTPKNSVPSQATIRGGLCLRFQKRYCNPKYCSYVHKCSNCGSFRHGDANCKKRKKKRRQSSPSPDTRR